jgi:demethylmenaquinone methyltransferase/2-methoxy-6-polyprenyl-1,4-benzoquinol methylase
MFDRIAPVYDAMNRVMTAGLDQRWRRATVRVAVRPGDRVLDACCGTGDLAVAARAAGAVGVVGVDFSERMLERARRKAPELEWVQADVLALPFDDASFDSAVVGFGVRNVEDLEAALRELRRVLRPGGRLGILEITTPRGLLAPFTRTSPRACAAFPVRRRSQSCSVRAASVPWSSGFSPGVSWPCT